MGDRFAGIAIPRRRRREKSLSNDERVLRPIAVFDAVFWAECNCAYDGRLALRILTSSVGYRKETKLPD